MGVINLFLRHLLDDFLLADGRVRVTADSRQRVPHISTDKVRCGHADAFFVVPADTRLRTGMPLHGGPQIPFERANRVFFDTKPKGVHDADQLLSVGIAGAGEGPKRLAGFLEFVGLHQIAGRFDIGEGWRREQRKREKKSHWVVSLLGAVWLGLAAAASAEPVPITPELFDPIDEAKAEIGRLLFYDPILSGNRNISCGTCHNHTQFSADGVSLGIGEGGIGAGPKRIAPEGDNAIKKRVPRHAPALWNIGAKEFQVFFNDGRVSASKDYEVGINSPAEEFLPDGLDSLLAAQALFPMTAQFEMAGNPKENEIAGAIHDRIDQAWPIIAKRVRGIEHYAQGLSKAFGVAPEEVSIVEIGNALAAFMASEWRSFDAPFDLYLAGKGGMDEAQIRGMDLFYGKANCSSCHSGPFQTDHKFYAIGLPAFGPGRTRMFDPIPRDVGRMSESSKLEDAYRFRTPSLRNVELTAPYGHNGAYPTLEGIIRHHLNPNKSRAEWTRDMARLPSVPWLEEIDFAIQSDTREMARQEAVLDIAPVNLADEEVADLIAFLKALTGGESRFGRLGRPEAVPSGLKVD